MNDEMSLRRAAIASLGRELRFLVDAAVRTGAHTDTLHRVATDARQLADRLSVRRRTRHELPAVDQPRAGLRMYSPVCGTGNPLAPPVEIQAAQGSVTGRCVLGLAHEGPPTYAHGGISALLLDDLMGRACTTVGPPVMTVALEMRYRRPVPLETPLLLSAVVTAAEERRRIVRGAISTAAEPDWALVEAEGTFLVLRPEQSRSLFSEVTAAQ